MGQNYMIPPTPKPVKVTIMNKCPTIEVIFKNHIGFLTKQYIIFLNV